MLIAVRHGSTQLNDGTEKLRGRLPVPLSNKGKEEAIDAASKLKDLNLSIDSFHSSPLKRALQSSEHITDELGISPVHSDKLLDWDTGIYTGKEVKPTLPEIHRYIDNPDKSIPQGESYNTFYNRTQPFLDKLVKDDKVHLIVSHNRVMTLISAIANNDDNLMKKKGPIEPGGILLIDPDWNMSIAYKENGHG